MTRQASAAAAPTTPDQSVTQHLPIQQQPRMQPGLDSTHTVQMQGSSFQPGLMTHQPPHNSQGWMSQQAYGYSPRGQVVGHKHPAMVQQQASNQQMQVNGGGIYQQGYGQRQVPQPAPPSVPPPAPPPGNPPDSNGMLSPRARPQAPRVTMAPPAPSSPNPLRSTSQRSARQ